jgi:hypothetical protein
MRLSVGSGYVHLLAGGYRRVILRVAMFTHAQVDMCSYCVSGYMRLFVSGYRELSSIADSKLGKTTGNWMTTEHRVRFG